VNWKIIMVRCFFLLGILAGSVACQAHPASRQTTTPSLINPPTLVATYTPSKIPLPSATASPNLTQQARLVALFTQIAEITPSQTPSPEPTYPTEEPSPTETPFNFRQISVRKIDPEQIISPPWVGYQHPYDATARIKTIQAGTDALNAANGDIDTMLEIISSWSPNSPKNEIKSVWIYPTDLDDDGEMEWLVSLPFLFISSDDNPKTVNLLLCGVNFCDRIMILYRQIAGKFVPIAEIPFGGVRMINVDRVADINADGRKEVVFSGYWGGNGASGQGLYIGTWQNKQWKWLSKIEEMMGVYQFVNLDPDPALEIAAEFGTTNTLAGGMFQRGGTRYYDWQGSRYVTINMVRKEPELFWYSLLDAQTALSQGDTAQAKKLLTLFISQNEPDLPIICKDIHIDGGFFDIFDDRNIWGYATIEWLLAEMLEGKSPELPMQMLNVLQTCQVEEIPYLNAAQLMQTAYEQTGNPLLACQAMEEYILQETGWREVILTKKMMRMERISPEDFGRACPLLPSRP